MDRTCSLRLRRSSSLMAESNWMTLELQQHFAHPGNIAYHWMVWRQTIFRRKRFREKLWLAHVIRTRNFVPQKLNKSRAYRPSSQLLWVALLNKMFANMLFCRLQNGWCLELMLMIMIIETLLLLMICLKWGVGTIFTPNPILHHTDFWDRGRRAPPIRLQRQSFLERRHGRTCG